MWLLLDVDFPAEAYRELERRGHDVVHAGVEGLADEDDRQLLEYAIADGCVLVTRNYADFTRLSETYAHRGSAFPGILFVPPSLDPADVAGHVATIERWLAGGDGRAARVANRCRWLEPPAD